MIIGLVSGFFGSKTDIIIQRFVDGWMCFPPMLIYLSVMALLGPGLWQVIFVLGITRGIRQSRIVRGAVIGIKENVYVEAARAIGASNMKILARHILPNVMAPIITILAVSCGYMILSEATLSFLGFGVPPPEPTWGGMLSGSGRQYMYHAPWLALWPGVALASVVYGLNMFGDAVRDILDPRMRGGLGRYGRIKVRKHQKVSPAS
jgi:peptide/nickel transport system permease protein